MKRRWLLWLLGGAACVCCAPVVMPPMPPLPGPGVDDWATAPDASPPRPCSDAGAGGG
jgi:hypothetical protein